MLLVVFDLNGTLAALEEGACCRRRPYLKELLGFLCEMHDQGELRFATWTSRQTSTANKMVYAVFPPEACKRLLFTLDRSKCTLMDDKRHSVKDLRNIWDAYTAFNINNTVMVDDTMDKFLYSQRRALYEISTWERDEDDQALLGLIDYLKYRILIG
jgi:hypothetical protein